MPPPTLFDLVTHNTQQITAHDGRIKALEDKQRLISGEVSALQGQMIAQLAKLDQRHSQMQGSLELVVKEYDERTAARMLTDKLLRRTMTTIQLFLGIAAVAAVIWGVFHFAVTESIQKTQNVEVRK